MDSTIARKRRQVKVVSVSNHGRDQCRKRFTGDALRRLVTLDQANRAEEVFAVTLVAIGLYEHLSLLADL